MRKQSEITFKQPEPEKPKPVVESVWIPFLISLVTGLLLTGFAVLGVQVLWEVWLPWTWAAFMFAGVTLGTWILQNWHVVLWEAEERTGVDLDRDGHIGDPSRGYVLLDAGPPEEHMAREVDQLHDRYCQFVRAAGENTATRPLVKAGFSRPEIEYFRGLLMRGRHARWKNPRTRTGGWYLTRSVERILAHVR